MKWKHMFALMILAFLFANVIIYNVRSDLHQLVRPKRKLKPEESELFESSDLSRRFDSRVKDFFRGNESCKVNIFMSWIAPAGSFRKRQFSGMDSVFQTNPRSCLVILSKSMDSVHGDKILEPLIRHGFRVMAVTPDLWDLCKGTPAESWLNEIKNGSKDPGAIPLAQNLSNLMRLAALYKYGGVYLDTDFVILKDLSGLRNVIGAQSVKKKKGNPTKLNNAILVFDREHPIVYKFMEEFASTFDGNRWDHNGPLLVTRVVDRVARNKDFKFRVLPQVAFYPVDWNQIAGFFIRPSDPANAKWFDVKIRWLNDSSYGVYLWHKESGRFNIEQGSIIDRLLNDHCVICTRDVLN